MLLYLSNNKMSMKRRCSHSILLYLRLLLIAVLMNQTTSLSSSTSSSSPRYIGFDLGTSGCRISIIQDKAYEKDGSYEEVYTHAVTWGDPSQKGTFSNFSYDDEKAWLAAVEMLLKDASEEVNFKTVKSICISGTSASCLVVDVRENRVTRAPRMYNYDVKASQKVNEDPLYPMRAMDLLDEFAPLRHTARAQTGSLAKLLTWNEENKFGPSEVLCHQSDYVSMRLLTDDRACGAGPRNTWRVSSDWHNCLKLGYDVQNKQWPDWMVSCLQKATGRNDPLRFLPETVVSPGAAMGTISQDFAEKYGFSEDCTIVGGTTDSNAAFFAAAGTQPVAGIAVTSLGSTLAMKYLSETYVEDADRGVYSHRFPSVFPTSADWLAGGASNVGCAILRQEEFKTEELVSLSASIDPISDSPLKYYPLCKKGERFPISDSNKEPVLLPKPMDRRSYLHGILQGISDVERDGFKALFSMGASPARPKVVLTSGGGSNNDMWSKMRERRLNEAFPVEKGDEQPIKVLKADNIEPSYGAAILAAAGSS